MRVRLCSTNGQEDAGEVPGKEPLTPMLVHDLVVWREIITIKKKIL